MQVNVPDGSCKLLKSRWDLILMRAVQPGSLTLSHSSGPCTVQAPFVRKEALGQVFTPPVLVEFILDQAGFGPKAGIIEKPLLEGTRCEGRL